MHYNDYDSDKKYITHGVPQGSVLGPLLFIIYIHDFSRCPDLLFSVVFADDTNVVIEGTNYDKIIYILNKELTRIDIWLKANKLTIHYIMVHRTRIKCEQRPVTICGNSLTTLCEVKTLLVIFRFM